MYNILICDDEPDIVSALKIYLSGEDYRLFTASDGEEALRIARENELHLVLMDVMMPKLDGITATARLRQESNVPILMLTAKGESSDKVLGLNVGADGCAPTSGATPGSARSRRRRAETSMPSVPSGWTTRPSASPWTASPSPSRRWSTTSCAC